ncbi:hypothetical protein ACIHDR_06310 [Nocardia sp. NPDC052278]|uniref:hypothetical protein n=1 Tax=Nocardia sp. NPDC052278 TaxID=3364328 RepID=UPI0037C9AF53
MRRSREGTSATVYAARIVVRNWVTCRKCNSSRCDSARHAATPRALLPCQRRGHQREVAAGDIDRALPEVPVDRLVRIGFDDAEGALHVADGVIAESGARL